MKDWLLEQYASSTFNTCPHQQLPSMSGPPVEIHLKDNAVPVARHKAIPIPVHWQDLLRDKALGVVERVPMGEPVEWCNRMVVTRKHDGSPRWTVDLSSLNKWCKRHTIPSHPSTLPDEFHAIHGRQSQMHGTDSVPLRESDRHLTTFITPLGVGVTLALLKASYRPATATTDDSTPFSRILIKGKDCWWHHLPRYGAPRSLVESNRLSNNCWTIWCSPELCEIPVLQEGCSLRWFQHHQRADWTTPQVL